MAIHTLARDRGMQRRLDRPVDPQFVRLELDKATLQAVADAAHVCGLSLASFCRLALELLSSHQKVTVEDVRKEADRRHAAAKAETKKGKK